VFHVIIFNQIERIWKQDIMLQFLANKILKNSKN